MIVNPKASHLDLLAWCWGEIQSIQAAAQAVGALQDPLSLGDFSAIFQQRLDPLAAVMDLAMHELHAASLAKKTES